MPNRGEEYLKEFESALKIAVRKLSEELMAIRGSRPSVELVENIKVNYYDQMLPIKQLGSLSIVPPRGIKITVWDKNAVGPTMKAIEAAQMGLSVSNEGNSIIATLSPLGDERREELTRLVRKTAEAQRIQIRAKRDEIIKKLKEAEANKEVSEDEAFKSKTKAQKIVDETNKEIEKLVEEKLKELAE
jgi:ribosome recycling factor